MSNRFEELKETEFTHELVLYIVPKLKRMLQARHDGHCMRVADLDEDLMISVARSLKSEVPQFQIHVLTNAELDVSDDLLYVSSTKLVELRNPRVDGTLRAPLLVFIPPFTRASAEDSFGIATFEEVVLSTIYAEIIENLVSRLPANLQYIRGILMQLSSSWSWSNSVAQVRFLLTAFKNGIDAEVLGASLYELGLVPDFKVFQEPQIAFVEQRVKRNVEAAREVTHSSLSTRSRVLNLGLVDRGLQQRLIDHIIHLDIGSPYNWTKQIVIDPRNWDLAFQNWQFTDQKYQDKVRIRVLDTDLPVADNEGDERLHDIIGQRFLAPQDRRKFQVTFEVHPHPTQVSGLSYFSVQVLARDLTTGSSSIVGSTKNVKVWKSAKLTAKVTLDKLNRVDFDEGWHFVRVLPWTEDGDPILLDEGSTPDNPLHESDLFYVIPDEQFAEEPPQRAIPKVESFGHARLRVQFTALNEQGGLGEVDTLVLWADSSHNQGASDTLVIQYGKYGAFQVSIPTTLRVLEDTILDNADGVASWELTINRGSVSSPKPESKFPSNLTNLPAFRQAREQYFSALRGSNKLVSQGADFVDLAPLIYEYAQSYLDILEELSTKIRRDDEVNVRASAIQDLRRMLAVDSFRIELVDFIGKSREAILLSPTHPLRALWFCSWTSIGQEWMHQLENASNPQYANPVRGALFSMINPLHFPVGIPSPHNRIFVNLDNLNSAWTIYGPTTEQDTLGLVNEIRKALQVPEITTGTAQISGELIASRIARYIQQHPYTHTLNINVFNPGSGQLLADALLNLQKYPGLGELRYNLRMFVANPDALGVGEAVTDLLHPILSVGSESSEAFSSPTGNHLFPKLNIALQSINNFSDAPPLFQAHISMLFDIFPATEVSTTGGSNLRSTLPIRGLVQDFAVTFTDDEVSGTAWRRQPVHGVASFEPSSDLIGELPRVISASLATVATGVPSFNSTPVLTMSLAPNQRQLLHQIHDSSDWVFTIDRHIGIELFDHGGKPGKTNYLIDYSPSISSSFSPSLIITTRSLTEIQGMLAIAAEKLNLSLTAEQFLGVFDQLRFLSGRIALKLLSASDNQAMEAIGLGLARLYLQKYNVFGREFVLPLDDCLNLFRDKSRVDEDMEDAISLKRTDIALVKLNGQDRTIQFHLIEVKSYRRIGDLGSYVRLKDAIRNQIQNSEDKLRSHFDSKESRPDRLLKNRELYSLLVFYLDRARRYGLLGDAVYGDNLRLLQSLDEGYELRFQRSALLFDFDYADSEIVDEDDGITFVHVGIELISDLLRNTFFIQDAAFRHVQSDDKVAEVTFVAREEGQFIAEVTPEAQPADLAPSEYIYGDDNHENQVLVDSSMSFSVDNHPEILVKPDSEVSGVQSGPSYEVMLGETGASPQYCILGEVSGRKVALDWNQTHTISLFGVQGSGKSYTLGSLIESGTTRIEGINLLPSPLATVVFHYSQTREYIPEYVSMVQPNRDALQLEKLATAYGAQPQQLSDIVLLAPRSKLYDRQREFPNLTVLPLSFASSELSAIHWRYLMGAVGNQSLYLRQLNLIIRQLGSSITVERLREDIEASKQLREQARDQAILRLQLAEQYIDDGYELGSVIKPGRLVIVDLRDESVEQREALELFAVMLQIFSNAHGHEQRFNKLVVFDEAHKYMNHPDLIDGIVELVREMRHKATSILIASQEPRSVPVSLIELSTEIILHRFNAPQWLKHVQNANIALSALTAARLSKLKPGEAYVWSNKATDDMFTSGAAKIDLRPRVTQHGGGTKMATE